jgi:hypothetical protein
MVLPKPGPLPQTSQLAATGYSKDRSPSPARGDRRVRMILARRDRVRPASRTTSGARGTARFTSDNRSSIQRPLPYNETIMAAPPAVPDALAPGPAPPPAAALCRVAEGRTDSSRWRIADPSRWRIRPGLGGSERRSQGTGPRPGRGATTLRGHPPLRDGGVPTFARLSFLLRGRRPRPGGSPLTSCARPAGGCRWSGGPSQATDSAGERAGRADGAGRRAAAPLRRPDAFPPAAVPGGARAGDGR